MFSDTSASDYSNQPTPLTTPSFDSTPSVGKRKRNNMERKDQIDLMLIDALSKESNTRTSNNDDNIDADMLFFKSMAPLLRKLPPKKNRLLKIDMQKLCLEYEFDDE